MQHKNERISARRNIRLKLRNRTHEKKASEVVTKIDSARNLEEHA